MIKNAYKAHKKRSKPLQYQKKTLLLHSIKLRKTAQKL